MTLDLQKLAAAKLWLISTPTGQVGAESPRDLPYLAHALYALIPVASEDVQRLACDEWWRIYVNPEWLIMATVREIGEELAHICWHLLAEHAERARSQDVDRASAADWKLAADITIAHTLEPDELAPDELPTAKDHQLTPGLSAEQYFAMIGRLAASAPGETTERPADEPESSETCGSGADGIARPHELGPYSDIAAVSTFDAREIRRRVAIEYRETATRRGDQPGDALRWVESILEPTTSWEPLLTGAVRRAVGWAAGRSDFTYARPSRRASSTPGIILPGQHRPLPRIAILVDTSASVDDELLARALGEVDGVIAALGVPDTSVTVYAVDAAVQSASRVRRARDVSLAGAGGTDLRVGLRAVEAERPRPDIVIVFTDGFTPWPTTPPPGATLIAAILGRHAPDLPPTPEWAIRVECIATR